jgi:hypothetical protein
MQIEPCYKSGQSFAWRQLGMYKREQGMNASSRFIEQVLPLFFYESMGGTRSPHLMMCYHTYFGCIL